MGIIGSPRLGGNTDTLVNAILSSCQNNGVFTETVYLDAMNISHCNACNHCQSNGECIHRDDMQEIVTLMEKCDVWVLGTPIYWWGTTAQMKAFIDRWYGIKQSIFQDKKLLLVITMGGNDSYYSRHVVGMFEDICKYLGIDFLDSLIAPGMKNIESAKQTNSLLERAEKLGSMILPSEGHFDDVIKDQNMDRHCLIE